VSGSANCLICHAQDYPPDDALASAKTVRPAGGDTCRRCHRNISAEDVHTEAGLTCVSCHPSSDHQIQTRVECTNCHPNKPHADMQIDHNHNRLDCRACHVRDNAVSLTINTQNATPEPGSKWVAPQVTTAKSLSTFEWVDATGKSATPDMANARIVPIIFATILAPDNFDPAVFAISGQVAGPLTEYQIRAEQSHGITKNNVRTCNDCHGRNKDFNLWLGVDFLKSDISQ